MKTKVCTHCPGDKPLSAFYKKMNTYQSKCKVCKTADELSARAHHQRKIAQRKRELQRQTGTE